MTRPTTGSGPSNTWTPPTCACPPWRPHRRRARPTRTAWTSTSAGLVSVRRPPGLSGRGRSPRAACAPLTPQPPCFLPRSPRGRYSESCMGVGESAQSLRLPPSRLPTALPHRLISSPRCSLGGIHSAGFPTAFLRRLLCGAGGAVSDDLAGCKKLGLVLGPCPRPSGQGHTGLGPVSSQAVRQTRTALTLRPPLCSLQTASRRS